jgi:hypothetical protein
LKTGKLKVWPIERTVELTSQYQLLPLMEDNAARHEMERDDAPDANTSQIALCRMQAS